VDFVVGLVNSVLNLPDRLMKFLWVGRGRWGGGGGGIQIQKNRNQSWSSKIFLGPVEITFGLVLASYRLPEW